MSDNQDTTTLGSNPDELGELITALTAAGYTVAQGGNVIVIAVGAINDQAAKIAAFDLQLEELTTPAAAEEFSKLVGAALDRLGIEGAKDLSAEDFAGAINGVADTIEELKRAKTAAQKRARAAEAEAPAKPRSIGRINFPDGKPNAEQLLTILADADRIEIAFSDGKREVAGLPPRIISGSDAWVDAPAGLKLNVPDLTVHGPGQGGGGALKFAGYVLLVDGKPVAWSERPEDLTVGVGQSVQLKDDVIF